MGECRQRDLEEGVVWLLQSRSKASVSKATGNFGAENPEPELEGWPLDALSGQNCTWVALGAWGTGEGNL